MTTAQDVIDFWFSDSMRPNWYRKDQAIDQKIIEDFSDTYESARRGDLDAWMDTAQGALALMIVLDQFPRNMFRGSPRSFECCDLVLGYANRALDAGFDQQVSDEARAFFYLPYMHSENLADQDRSVALYQAAGNAGGLDFAHRHRDIIVKFGRFPHRNAVLGRETTTEEAEFLKTNPGF